MKILQSKSGNYYEFDPSASPISEDAWGKYYRGWCNNPSMPNNVLIYKLEAKLHCPEYLLRRLNTASHFCIRHPNIIPTIDFVEVHDDSQSRNYQLYFVEEYFQGVTLSDYLNGQIRKPKTNGMDKPYSLFFQDKSVFARIVIKEILLGLDFLHAKGVCIRYFDPESVFITDNCNVRIAAKSCYFRDIFAYNSHCYRTTSSFIDSLSGLYLAPEFITSEDFMKIDYRTDIYSVGILFFQLLTGHCPYKGQHTEILYQQVNTKMPLHEIEDKQLRKIVKKATEKDRSKRYQSASEFINALDNSMNVRIPWYKKIISFCTFEHLKK